MIPVREYFSTEQAKNAGPRTFTINVPSNFVAKQKCKPHYTYRIDHVLGDEHFDEAWFVRLLTGPDNYQDYKTFGKLDPKTGRIAMLGSSNLKPDSLPVLILRRCLDNIFSGNPEKITASGFDVLHSGKCARCGLKLTRPESIERGMGATCLAKCGG